MSNIIIHKLIIFVWLISIGCKGHSSGEQNTVQTSKAQTIVISTKVIEARVDKEKSIITWKGTKIMKAGKHEGTLKLKAGSLLFKDNKLAGGYFVADMNSITITDMPPHETTAIRNLTTHLKSDFNAQQYPTSTFEITHVEYLNDSMLKVRGNMTIKNITKNISIRAKINNGFNTRFTFNRFDWNIGNEGSWIEKRLVDEEVELNVKIAFQ